MARNLHDPVYVIGWISFISLLFLFILAMTDRPIPPILASAFGSSMTALVMATKAYVGKGGNRELTEEDISALVIALDTARVKAANKAVKEESAEGESIEEGSKVSRKKRPRRRAS